MKRIHCQKRYTALFLYDAGEGGMMCWNSWCLLLSAYQPSRSSTEYILFFLSYSIKSIFRRSIIPINESASISAWTPRLLARLPCFVCQVGLISSNPEPKSWHLTNHQPRFQKRKKKIGTFSFLNSWTPWVHPHLRRYTHLSPITTCLQKIAHHQRLKRPTRSTVLQTSPPPTASRVRP